MAESITQRINLSGMDQRSKAELMALFNALRADLLVMAAKLDADGGVTDTNYAASLTNTTA